MPAPQPNFVALSVTTSGPDPDRDAIVELTAARYHDGRRESVFHTAVEPEVDLLVEREPLEDTRPLGRALDDLERFIGTSVVVGLELEQGLRALRRHGALLRSSCFDLAELADVLSVDARDTDLQGLTRLVGSGLPDQAEALDGDNHEPQAVTDALSMARLYAALCARARNVAPDVLEAIVAIGEQASWPLTPVFRAAADDPESPEESGHRPAAPRPLRRSVKRTLVDETELDSHIAPDGTLANTMPGFEDRQGQREMLLAVCDAFNRGDELLVEAGTGTGKSLAYLLPAAAFAMSNGQPVVVATHTIALQDQLVNNDLPMARSLLGDELKFCVLKGRSNYLCRTRAAGLHARQEWSADEVSSVARLLIWASTTQTGDRMELRLRPGETGIWRMVSAESDACSSETCPHAAVGACWVHRARAVAEASHVVVVNHALLISDARINNRLLPPYEHLVIDEAHHLEAVATDAMGFSASRIRARQAVGSRDLAADQGLLARAAASAAASDLGDDVRTAVWESVTGLRALSKRAATDVDTLFDSVSSFLETCGASGADVRLTGAIRAREEWFPVESAWERFHERATELRKGIVRLGQALAAAEVLLDDGETLTGDLLAAAREIADVDTGLERAIVSPKANDIVWAARGDGRRVSVHRAPLVVGETLHRWLFEGLETLVLTSATLRTGDDFGFLRDRLMIYDAPELVVDSPFDFEASALLLLPTDMPPPGAQGYQEALDTALVTLASALAGRSLVLFTSHHGLRTTYHNVRAPLGALGITTLGQGLDGPRHALLERFRDASRQSVLLGTRSFWEGVDVPGDALSCLALARLPFDVPSDPVFAARAETFDEPFREYAVPLAVLRFRQGFGRLIRTRSDRGVVAVLDSRVLYKSYGHSFLSSLPPCNQHRAPLAELATAARRFLDGEPLEYEAVGSHNANT